MYAMDMLYNPKFTAKEIVGQVQEEIAQGAERWRRKERARARADFLRAARIKEVQSALTSATYLAQFEMFDGKPELITAELETYLAVTPAQIQAMVKKYLVPEKMAVLEIMPTPKEKK